MEGLRQKTKFDRVLFTERTSLSSYCEGKARILSNFPSQSSPLKLQWECHGYMQPRSQGLFPGKVGVNVNENLMSNTGIACAITRARGSWLKSRSNWNLEMLVFEERGKPEYPEKNLSEQGREPTTNSTHIWRRTRDTLVGGERSHHCAIPALPKSLN